MIGKTHWVGGLAFGLMTERAMLELAAPIIDPTSTIEAYGVPIPTVLVAFTTVSIASLFPDIDQPTSTIANWPRKTHQWLFPKRAQEHFVRTVIRQFFYIIFSPLNILMQVISKSIRLLAGGHRAGTHWLITCLAISGGIYLVGEYLNVPNLGIWFLVGYLSHLILDMMTIAGLKVLQPISQQSWHLLPKRFRIRTGGPFDHRLRGTLWLICLVLLVVAIFPLF